MKQLNHFNNYGHVLPKITSWLYNYTDQYGCVDMGLYWEPMGSQVLEFGFCKSTSNTMPGLAEKYWSQAGNIPYYQLGSSNNPVGGFNSDIFYVRAYVRNIAGTVWSNVVIVNTKNNRTYAPTVSTNPISNIYSTRGYSGGNVTTDGGSPVTERGVCWTSNPSVAPTVSNDRTIDGSGTGGFSSEMKNLTPNTSYYVRAYAINAVDPAYGSTVSFMTNAAGVPTAFIIDLQDISSSSVLAYGRIYDNGGSAVTQKGFVWNTSGNPNRTNDHVVPADGTGDADFNKAMSGLPSGTRIYAKAFGVNTYGTGYGDQTTFTTIVGADVVVFSLSTVSVSSAWKPVQINKTGATLHWEVTGAVTASADANTPTFNFSTPGTKNIVVTSPDGGYAISSLNFYQCGLTAIDISEASNTTTFSVEDNLLTSIDLSKLTMASTIVLNKNNLTTIDISKNQALQYLWIDNNQLTTLNASSVSGLRSVQAYNNKLTSVAFPPLIATINLAKNMLTVNTVNSLLDTLIGFNNDPGLSLNVTVQSPAIVPDAAKVTALRAIWDQVYI